MLEFLAFWFGSGLLIMLTMHFLVRSAAVDQPPGLLYLLWVLIGPLGIVVLIAGYFMNRRSR